MRIKLTSLMVEDQPRALTFYTEVLGMRLHTEMPAGEFRWLTVVAPDGYPDVQLSLEPNVNPAGRAFQEAMFEQGIPVAAFEVDDLQAEFARLSARGVVFKGPPAQYGPVWTAALSDTCGNWILLYQPPPG